MLTYMIKFETGVAHVMKVMFIGKNESQIKVESSVVSSIKG